MGEEPPRPTLEIASILRQGGRYLIVGFSSALIELVLFFSLHELLAAHIILSNVCAITIATAYNFWLSRTWTFRSVSSLPRSAVLYLLLFVFNQVFSSVTIVWLVGLGLLPILAKLFTMACIVCWNFVLYRQVIFR
ncbi:MAG: GtrA family protein [Coriobacteriales bacterium]|nr:GtrA family protein [Coriobacteriales bacterium]